MVHLTLGRDLLLTHNSFFFYRFQITVTSLILALCFCYHACLNGLMWLYHRSKLGILMTRKKTREEVLPEIEEILVCV